LGRGLRVKPNHVRQSGPEGDTVDLFWLVLLWPYALAFAAFCVLWFFFRIWLSGFIAEGGLKRRTKGYRSRHSASGRQSDRDQ